VLPALLPTVNDGRREHLDGGFLLPRDDDENGSNESINRERERAATTK